MPDKKDKNKLRRFNLFPFYILYQQKREAETHKALYKFAPNP